MTTKKNQNKTTTKQNCISNCPRTISSLFLTRLFKAYRMKLIPKQQQQNKKFLKYSKHYLSFRKKFLYYPKEQLLVIIGLKLKSLNNHCPFCLFN